MANAGVVGYAEVIQPNSTTSSNRWSLGTPATWSMIWVGLAVLFLVMVHMALIGRAAR